MLSRSQYDNLLFHVLALFASSEQPQGAGTILEGVKKKGFTNSESSIARLIRELRNQDYLTMDGKRGHIITSKGKEYLYGIEKERNLKEYLKNIVIKDKTNAQKWGLIDRLVARKALEREATYQATIHGTDEELNQIQAIANRQLEQINKNKNFSKQAEDFHKHIFKVSKSPSLQYLYNLLGLTTGWSDFFIGALRVYRTPLGISHSKIADAMRSRNPDLAAQKMELHLEEVILSAKKILSEISTNE